MSAPKIQEHVDMIRVAKSMDPVAVIESIAAHGYQHVVQEDALCFNEELQLSELMVYHPEEFIADPLRSIFGSQGGPDITYFRRSFSAHQNKRALLAELSDILMQIKGTQRVLMEALSISDELYTNAARNAWLPGGRPHIDPPFCDGTIEFFVGCDSERLVLGCSDNFGRLESQRMVNSIRRCTLDGVAEAIDYDSVGAGIGSFIVYDSAMAMYVGCDPKRVSVVCAALPLGLKRSVAVELPKNIHFATVR